MARDRLKGPEERASGPVGCNIFFIALVMALVAAFAIAAFLRSPNGSPEPVDTGIVPTTPSGSQSVR